MYDEMVAEARAEEAASAFEEAEAAKLETELASAKREVEEGTASQLVAVEAAKAEAAAAREEAQATLAQAEAREAKVAQLTTPSYPLVKSQFGRSGKGVGAIGCAARPIAAYRYARQ